MTKGARSRNSGTPYYGSRCGADVPIRLDASGARRQADEDIRPTADFALQPTVHNLTPELGLQVVASPHQVNDRQRLNLR
jgi:hypothetical protein